MGLTTPRMPGPTGPLSLQVSGPRGPGSAQPAPSQQGWALGGAKEKRESKRTGQEKGEENKRGRKQSGSRQPLKQGDDLPEVHTRLWKTMKGSACLESGSMGSHDHP